VCDDGGVFWTMYWVVCGHVYVRVAFRVAGVFGIFAVSSALIPRVDGSFS